MSPCVINNSQGSLKMAVSSKASGIPTMTTELLHISLIDTFFQLSSGPEERESERTFFLNAEGQFLLVKVKAQSALSSIYTIS